MQKKLHVKQEKHQEEKLFYIPKEQQRPLPINNA